MHSWTIRDGLELYNIPAWGDGLFDINEAGHLIVQPDADPGLCEDCGGLRI